MKVEAESGVEEFREKMKTKIGNIKCDIIASIEDHFKRV